MLELYAHPFSSYCQKVLIALYENGLPFTFRLLGPDDPETLEAFAALSPMHRMPVLTDDGRTVLESSVIIEYLGLHHPGPVRLVPEAPDAALDVRMLDRAFDTYVMTPMQKVVLDVLRPAADRDARGVGEARDVLDRAYRWLDGQIGTPWAAGSEFTLADCAAAPALFYADWIHPVPEGLPALRAYRARLCARPSFARAIEEARPYRPLFPPGAPERD
jgi:glutathione S-transferase